MRKLELERVDGEPVVGGPLEPLRIALSALADAVRSGRIRKLELERVDGEPVLGGPSEALLVELGFRSGPRRLTLSA